MHPICPRWQKKLGVDILFEGSVRPEGQRLRVTARMITPDGFQLWSQRFETEDQSTGPELSSIRRLRTSAVDEGTAADIELAIQTSRHAVYVLRAAVSRGRGSGGDIMRIQLIRPLTFRLASGIQSNVTMHGATMIFFVAMP